jgi:hypothetical protein
VQGDSIHGCSLRNHKQLRELRDQLGIEKGVFCLGGLDALGSLEHSGQLFGENDRLDSGMRTLCAVANPDRRRPR